MNLLNVMSFAVSRFFLHFAKIAKARAYGHLMVAHDKMQSWADLTVTICGSLGSLCGSVITVGLRLGLELRNVVYKLLEKVTKCGAIT